MTRTCLVRLEADATYETVSVVSGFSRTVLVRPKADQPTHESESL